MSCLGEHGTHGDGRVRHPLRHGEKVRHHTEVLGRERRPEAAEARDHFVEDEQDSVAIADFAQALEVAQRRHEHAGRAGHRLDDHRGDGRGIMQQTEPLQLVGELGAVLRLAPGEGVARQVVGVPDVVDASDAGAEHLLVER